MVHYSIINKSKIVHTPGGVAGENALKPKNGNILTEALLELKPGPQGPIIEELYLELVPT